MCIHLARMHEHRWWQYWAIRPLLTPSRTGSYSAKWSWWPRLTLRSRLQYPLLQGQLDLRELVQVLLRVPPRQLPVVLREPAGGRWNSPVGWGCVLRKYPWWVAHV